MFPDAGPMAKSKGKVDKGTGPAELEQGMLVLLSMTSTVWVVIPAHCAGKTYFFVVGSNLSGLKTSGSAKCSGIRHIVPVGS